MSEAERIRELELEVARLRKALEVGRDFRCEWHDCRRWTFKVSDEYCYFHKAVIEALEASDGI